MNGFRVRRDLPSGRYRLSQLVQGLDRVPSLVRLFGGQGALSDLLSIAEVELDSFQGYMWIDPEERCMMVSEEYLQEADDVSLYLDLIHEVVHLRQLSQGLELFDEEYTYDERPTELEAYRIALEEARRLGVSDDFLRDYLRVPWITEEQYQNLLGTLGVNPTPGPPTP